MQSRVWEALAQSQIKLNRVPEKVPEKLPGGFGAKPCQVQQGSGKVSGEGSGKPCCKAKLGSTGSEEKVPEENSGEGLGGFGAALLNLTWLCTKASKTFSGTFSRTFSGTFSNPSPEPFPLPSYLSETLLNLTWPC